MRIFQFVSPAKMLHFCGFCLSVCLSVTSFIYLSFILYWDVIESETVLMGRIKRCTPAVCPSVLPMLPIFRNRKATETSNLVEISAGQESNYEVVYLLVN